MFSGRASKTRSRYQVALGNAPIFVTRALKWVAQVAAPKGALASWSAAVLCRFRKPDDRVARLKPCPPRNLCHARADECGEVWNESQAWRCRTPKRQGTAAVQDAFASVEFLRFSKLLICSVIALCGSPAHATSPVRPRTITLAVTGTAFGPQANSSGTCTLATGPLVPVSTLAFSPDGKTLAIGGYKELLLLDVVNVTVKRLGAGVLSDAVHVLAFHKGGQLLAVGEGLPGRSGAVRVFDVATGKLVLDFSEPKDVVYAIAFSSDGKLLAAGGMDPVVRVWDIDQKKLVATLIEPRVQVLGIAFSHDGAHLAAGGADNTVHIWETATWKRVIRMPQPDRVNGIAFEPTDDSLATAIEGETTHGIRLQRIDYPEPEVASAASATATPVTTGSAQPTPKKIRKAPARILDTGVGMPLGFAWSGSGKNVKAYVACTDKIVRVFNGFGGGLAGFSGHDDWVCCAAVSPNGARLASGCADGTVKLWKTENNRLLATFVPIRLGGEQWAMITPRGTFCASGLRTIQFQAADGKALTAVAMSPLQNVELVRQALAAEPPPPPKKPKPQVPPVPKGAPAAKPQVPSTGPQQTPKPKPPTP